MNGTNFLLNRDKQFKKSIITDSLQILALYLFTALVIYKLPRITGYILFTSIILQFYKSKKDYFWLAFLFVICTGPGGFFYATQEVMIGQLPVFGLGGGINVSIIEVFLAAAILKVLTKGKKQQIPLSKPLLMIMFYSLFMFVISIVVFDTTLIRFLKDLRYFSYYFFIIPLSYLVYKEGDVEKLVYCIFPFVFVSFFAAIYYIFKEDYLVNLFAPGLMEQMKLGIEEGGARYGTSAMGGHLMLLLCYMSSLFLSFKEAGLKRRNIYLLLIAGISYFTMMLTGTRIWFVVFSFIFIMSVIFIKKNLKMLGGVLLIAALLYIPYKYISKIHDFSNKAWTRIESVFEMDKKGSVGYKALEHKKKRRWSRSLAGIKKSPWIGLGVSDQFRENSGGADAGNLSLIVQVGIIGFLLFANSWMKFFLMVSNVNKKLSPGNPYRSILFFFSISLLGILIAHFTTHQVFAMVTSKSDSIFLMLFLFLSGYFVKDAMREEYFLQRSAEKEK